MNPKLDQVELHRLLQLKTNTAEQELEKLEKLRKICVGQKFTVLEPPVHHRVFARECSYELPCWYEPVMDSTIGQQRDCLGVFLVPGEQFLLELSVDNGTPLYGHEGEDEERGYWYRFEWTQEGSIISNIEPTLIQLVEDLNKAETHSLNEVGPISHHLHEAIAALCQHVGLKNKWRELCAAEDQRSRDSKESARPGRNEQLGF